MRSGKKTPPSIGGQRPPSIVAQSSPSPLGSGLGLGGVSPQLRVGAFFPPSEFGASLSSYGWVRISEVPRRPRHGILLVGADRIAIDWYL